MAPRLPLSTKRTDTQPDRGGGLCLINPDYRDYLFTAYRQSDGATRKVYADRLGRADIADLNGWAGSSAILLEDVADQWSPGEVFAKVGTRMVLRTAAGRWSQTRTGALCALATGSSGLTTRTPNLSWGNTIVINLVMQKTLANALGPTWIAGVDFISSSFRDIEIFEPINGTGLRFGQDNLAMTPATATLPGFSIQSLTAIRYRTAQPNLKGHLRRNGVVVDTYTSNVATTDLQPNRFSLFADPDGAGFGSWGSYAPANWAFMETSLFYNGKQPSLPAIEALERAQGLRWGITEMVGAVVEVAPPSNGIPIKNSSGVITGYVTTDDGLGWLQTKAA